MTLGCFANAEEAALCVARSPEGQAAAQKAAAVLTSEQARQQVQAEGLTLRVADNTTGYFGVHHQPGRTKPYEARVSRGGKQVSLGSFATAEEAALCIARSPEGQVIATELGAAAAPLQPSSPAPAPPVTARCTAPPPRRWQSFLGARPCHRATPAPRRVWAR